MCRIGKRSSLLVPPRSMSTIAGRLRLRHDQHLRAIPPRCGACSAHNPAVIARSIEAFAARPNAGLVVLPSLMTESQRELIATLAAKHRMPAVYAIRTFVTSGGLACYGTDWVDLYRRAALSVDRIFKGAKPADLPVQQPTKFELGINLKTAKAHDLEVPPTLLARADEVIE